MKRPVQLRAVCLNTMNFCSIHDISVLFCEIACVYGEIIGNDVGGRCALIVVVVAVAMVCSIVKRLPIILGAVLWNIAVSIFWVEMIADVADGGAFSVDKSAINC